MFQTTTSSSYEHLVWYNKRVTNLRVLDVNTSQHLPLVRSCPRPRHARLPCDRTHGQWPTDLKKSDRSYKVLSGKAKARKSTTPRPARQEKTLCGIEYAAPSMTPNQSQRQNISQNKRIKEAKALQVQRPIATYIRATQRHRHRTCMYLAGRSFDHTARLVRFRFQQTRQIALCITLCSIHVHYFL